jgi:phage major head subunit gpT-like protein
MTFEEFKQSTDKEGVPSVKDELKALWYDAKGEWEAAHDLAQQIDGTNGAWIHAYLHREEGDNSNANYWYNRAGKTMPAKSLQQEWEDLVKEFLN